MGKKTKKDKDDLRRNLNLQMNLLGEIACRNPKIKALQGSHISGSLPRKSYTRQFNILYKEIHGEAFPWFPFPVLRLEQFEEDENELVLRIDMNYTKDEIMFIVENYVTNEATKYKKTHKVKHKRKSPAKKWIDYLEIWDLRNGDPPWVKVGMTKLPFGKKGKQGIPWTYEEIAKHIYPDAQTPKELSSAKNRVKKQFRAAYQLICGEKYDPEKIERQTFQFRGELGDQNFLCMTCPKRNHCEDICPQLAQDLASREVKQKDLLVGNLGELDTERYKGTPKRLPTAEEQFKKMY